MPLFVNLGVIQRLLPGFPCPLSPAVTTTGQLLVDDSAPVVVNSVRIVQYKHARGGVKSCIGGFQYVLGALKGPHYLQGVRWRALHGGGRALQLWVSRGGC